MSQLDRQNSISSIDLNQSIEEIKDGVSGLDEPYKTGRSVHTQQPVDHHNKTIQELPDHSLRKRSGRSRKHNIENRSFTGARDFISSLKVPKLSLKKRKKPQVQYLLVQPHPTSRSTNSRRHSHSPSPPRNYGIQNEDEDHEGSDIPTNYTRLQPGMPGYNQVFHSNQSMGQSSTMMPVYTLIIPKNQEFYASIARRAKIPPVQFENPNESSEVHSVVISEEMAEVEVRSPEFGEPKSEKLIEDNEANTQNNDESLISGDTANTKRSDNSVESADQSIVEGEAMSEMISGLFEYPSNYHDFAKFGVSNFRCVDQYTLQLIRVFMLVPILVMFLAGLAVNRTLMWFLYYESFWALMLTAASIITSIAAVKSPKWQTCAFVSTELAFAFNMVMTPFFWIRLAPEIFRQLGDDATWSGSFMRVHLTTLHSLPLIFLLVHISFTKIVFLRSDHKFCGLAGLTYMIFNGIGTLAIGHPLYPIFDWQPFSLTVGYFLLQCLLLQAIHYLAAVVLQKIHNYEE